MVSAGSQRPSLVDPEMLARYTVRLSHYGLAIRSLYSYEEQEDNAEGKVEPGACIRQQAAFRQTPQPAGVALFSTVFLLTSQAQMAAMATPRIQPPTKAIKKLAVTRERKLDLK